MDVVLWSTHVAAANVQTYEYIPSQDVEDPFNILAPRIGTYRSCSYRTRSEICNAVHTTNHHVSRVFTRVLAVGYSGGCRGHGSPMVRLLHFYVRKESYVAFYVDEVAVAF